MNRAAAVLGLGVVLLHAAVAHAGIADTVHNLAVSGPGPIKAPGVGEICVFCHTPHRAVQTRALWNRDLPPVTYKLYESSTLEAALKQPTGASRLCLSCHDGTTALGNLRVPSAAGRVTLAPLAGRASLGTDLSDDHPVSFVFDSALALKQGQLADPSTIPGALRLDDARQLQCTTCHDPHEDRNRRFLRVDDRAAALCTGCHRQQNWTGSTHASSPATWRGTGTNPWPNSPYTTVADNGCGNCHRSHAAPHPPRLLSSAEERAVCLVCHAGSVAAKNLDSEFLKPSAHPIMATDWTHEPREDPNTMPRHVTCTDCHNPHQVTGAPATAGRNATIVGFETGYSAASIIYCTDCHNNDQWTPSGTRPRGPHGSRYAPILERNYDMNDFTSESYQSYATCYKCHNRDLLINDSARTFPHRKHVVEKQAPCAACHDAHGSRQNSHLIDFMVRDRAGRAVVSPSQSQKRLEYVSLGQGRGQCYLICHGTNHEPKTYP